MTQSNNTPLAFYTDVKYQNHNKWWVDEIHPFITESKYIPPFQFSKSKGGSITSFELIDMDGNILDIQSESIIRGLQIKTNLEWDYDLVYYPSSIAHDFELVGMHYLKIVIGEEIFYSEIFNFCKVDGLIKIEYWHCEDLIYPGGHFDYSFPFKHRVFIKSDIGKPSYEYEEKVSNRDGYKFFIQQITWKQHQFTFLGSEYFIDALRLIRLHDNVEITYNGQLYKCDEILMDNPRWLDKGDFANVNIEMKTDTVVVVNGRSYEDCEFEVQNGTCVMVDYSAEASILDGSLQYSQGYYINNESENVNFVDGDIALISTFLNKNLFIESNVIDGYFLSDTGAIVQSALYYYIDYFIPVNNDVLVCTEDIRFITYYDINQNIVGGVNPNTPAGTSFTTPSNATHMRYTGRVADKATTQLEKASSSTPYVKGEFGFTGQTFNSGTFTLIPPIVNDKYYNKMTNNYYFVDSFNELNTTHISSITDFKVFGMSFENLIIVVYGRYQNGDEVVIGDGSSNDLNTVGIPINIGDGVLIDQVRIKATSYICNEFHVSDWVDTDFNGIGDAIIGSTFVVY